MAALNKPKYNFKAGDLVWIYWRNKDSIDKKINSKPRIYQAEINSDYPQIGAAWGLLADINNLKYGWEVLFYEDGEQWTGCFIMESNIYLTKESILEEINNNAVIFEKNDSYYKLD